MAGGPVLVPAEDSDELFRVDLESGFAESVGVGDFPHDATALGDRVFVGNEMGDTLSVIEDDEVVETVDAPVQPGSVVSSSGLIAVIAVAERVLTVYDPETLEELGTTDAGEGPTHIRTIGDRSYVIDTQGDAILEYKISRSGAELVDETPVEGTPYGVGVDLERRRLWVTLTELNEAVEFSTGRKGLEEIARYPTVEQPNTIGIDPRTGAALVAGATEEGSLQRIDPEGD
jgi:DNA-binding beta-propeller fold protein YncE